MTIENTREQLEQIRDLIGEGCTDAVLAHIVDQLRSESDDPVAHAEQMPEREWLDILDEAVAAETTKSDRYEDQPEDVKERARSNWLAAYDDGEPITDAEIDQQIVQGRLYCPHCGAWDCDGGCEDEAQRISLHWDDQAGVEPRGYAEVYTTEGVITDSQKVDFPVDVDGFAEDERAQLEGALLEAFPGATIDE